MIPWLMGTATSFFLACGSKRVEMELNARHFEVAASISDDESIQIASELVAIPSFTGEETKLARHIHAFLTANGIRAELQEVEPDRFQVIAWVGPVGPKPALMLNGHLDIDPLGRHWPESPFSTKLVGNKLYGAGIHNMKSGLTAIIAATLALHRSDFKLQRPLLLTFVIGELQGGKGTVFALQSGLTADAAVVPEPYSVTRVITRTAGVHKFAIVARGVTAHTSRHLEGVDAIQALRNVLDAIDAAPLELLDPDFPELPRIQVASIIAGRGEQHDLSGISYCADKATALIDLRYSPFFEPMDIQRRLEELVASLGDQYSEAEIELVHPPDPVFRVGGVDMPPMDVPADISLVRDLTALLPKVSDYAVHETGAVIPFSYCGNDTAHLSRAGIECCLFGPRGDADDTERHVLLSEMQACARTLSVLAATRCA
jgi:acetylornithine deacetylase